MSKKPKTLNKLNFSLIDVVPKTKNQAIAFESDKNLVLHGAAGTGKTYIALFMALLDIANETKTDIKIIRSAVPTRDLGFLPGTEEEKTKVYEEPYEKICAELLSRGDAYKALKDHNLLRFMTTSHLRGLSFDNSFILVDECQNMNFHELDSIITRVGNNCRLIFCGDFLQSDLNTKRGEQTGLKEFFRILRLLPEFAYIEFDLDDIVRGDLVKSYLITKYRALYSA